MASLIENGVNPEALAAVVKELKRETEALKVSQSSPPLTLTGSNRQHVNLDKIIEIKSALKAKSIKVQKSKVKE